MYPEWYVDHTLVIFHLALPIQAAICGFTYNAEAKIERVVFLEDMSIDVLSVLEQYTVACIYFLLQ